MSIEEITYEDAHTARLIHSASEEHILFIARVSSNQENTDPKLLRWLIEKNHWSPFQMVSACIEISTTRDIGRQILRHMGFIGFQEFSGRYAAYADVADMRQVRFTGTNNRQGSVQAEPDTANWTAKLHFEEEIRRHAEESFSLYQAMLNTNVAPEAARAVLPEGLTPTKMYTHGSLRSWIHYLRERMLINQDAGLPWAQLEHYWIARHVYEIIGNCFPVTWTAIRDMGYIDEPRFHL